MPFLTSSGHVHITAAMSFIRVNDGGPINAAGGLSRKIINLHTANQKEAAGALKLSSVFITDSTGDIFPFHFMEMKCVRHNLLLNTSTRHLHKTKRV